MLSKEETKLIEEELDKYPLKSAACIEALKDRAERAAVGIR